MDTQSKYDVIIVGGGAAGFFAAINCAEARPELKIAILEKGKNVLQKVKISGGGRCNVTHACFEPRELVKNYPRGAKALRGPFSRFCTGDTMGWYDDRGVALKIEEDGRVFPESNKSQSIINCLLEQTEKYNIQILKHQNVHEIIPPENGGSWILKTKADQFSASNILIATGSSPRVWEMLKKLGHQIVEPVPSLFTFNIKDSRIEELAGLSVPTAQVKINILKKTDHGPLLITHWGLSGPAILKLSAWCARDLHDLKYQFEIQINWLGFTSFEDAREEINRAKQEWHKKQVATQTLFQLPQRLWKKMLLAAECPLDRRWADVSKKQINKLANELTAGTYTVNGKSTFKEEFVTAGGINLKEIDFKRFESKLHPGLFFAGEVLNIDAVTGGFNFQAAWTGGWIVGQSLAESL